MAATGKALTPSSSPVPRGLCGPQRVGGRANPKSWPLYLILLGLPLWWALGAVYFVWPVLTFPLLLSLFLRKEVALPPRFGIWLLFLAWMVLAGIQLEDGTAGALFAYRASLYASATVLFLYVYNASERRLPDSTVFNVLTAFWAILIAGGFLGLAFPTLSFSTPVEAVLPASVLQDETAYYFVHPALSEVMDFLGYPVGRPKFLFAYSNQWGACVALLTPIALGRALYARSGPRAWALRAGLVLSVIPIVVSLNRGLWLALGLGLIYALLRSVRGQAVTTTGAVLLGVTTAAVLLLASPLRTLAEDRVTNENNSNESRVSVYAATLEEVGESPLVGYGSPSGQLDLDQQSRVGTQGQLFTIVFSYGVPALVFFAGFLVYTLVRSGRRGSPARFWSHVALLVLLVEMPYYNYMPTTLHVAMIIAALAWRDITSRNRRGAAPAGAVSPAAPKPSPA